MKSSKTLLLLGCCLLISMVTSAQENPHKVSIRLGYGFWSLPDLGSNFFSGWSDIEYEKDKVIGPLFLGLSYNLTEKIELGFSGTYNRITEEGRYKSGKAPGTVPPEKVVRIKDSRYYSVMMFLNITWRQENKVKYYSGGAFGTAFGTTDEWFHGDKLMNEP